jgi:hypothetical protein
MWLPCGCQVTPTFTLYRGGSAVATVSGVSEVKLLRAMVDQMQPRELEGHEEDLLELEVAEAELAAQEEAERKLKDAAAH